MTGVSQGRRRGAPRRVNPFQESAASGFGGGGGRRRRTLVAGDGGRQAVAVEVAPGEE
jgi:hypothetical protein